MKYFDIRDIFQWLVIGLTLARSTFALASASDFFCRAAIGHRQAVYFDQQLRDCGGTKPDHKSGVCQEQVECAFLASDVRERILADYVQAHPEGRVIGFQNIPQAELSALLGSYGFSLTWRPSVATCAGVVKAGTTNAPSCPSPNVCKGDLLFRSQPALIEASSEGESADPTVGLPGPNTPQGAGAAR